MRDIFDDIFINQRLDPMQSARRGARPVLRKRFYREATAGAGEGGGFPLLLDGKPVKTPARRPLAAPMRTLALAIAAEWNAQAETIDPARMPLTRLANAVTDAVADQAQAVTEEVAKYLGSDLLCYRADAPEGLVERQARAWDPVLAWAAEALGARFVLAQGVVHVAQPREAIVAARAGIPADPSSLKETSNLKEIWRLGAVASITALTGSGLLALALAHGAIEADAAWAAAHVDEDWQMAQWGRDQHVLERSAFHFAEFQAATKVLGLVA